MKEKDLSSYKEFIRFLKDNNIYKSFFENYNTENGIAYRKHFANCDGDLSVMAFVEFCRDSDKFVCEKEYHNLNQIVICVAFEWSRTPQGHTFWENIYTKK